jgi:acetyltransferase-like isoleucine patch superfamily enzyme
MSTFLEALKYHEQHHGQFLIKHGVDIDEVHRAETQFTQAPGGGFYHKSCTASVPNLGKNTIVFDGNELGESFHADTGCLILGGNDIQLGVVVGKNVTLGGANYLGRETKVEDGASIGDNNFLTSAVKVGPTATIGSNCTFPPRTVVGAGQVIENGTTAVPERYNKLVRLTEDGEVVPSPESEEAISYRTQRKDQRVADFRAVRAAIISGTSPQHRQPDR